ncbi:MAG: acetate--CoA ligase, partial [Novosphingobium sp.]
MSTTHPVPPAWAAKAYVDAVGYAEKYRRSLEEPEAFWREESARLDWMRPWTQLSKWSYDQADFGIEWFADGTLNVSANCLDRHLAENGDTVAIIWEGDDAAQQRRLTYRELHSEVCRMANALLGLGVAKGDRVTIYLPMIPEAAMAMLACSRIGAIHSVVFGGFSPEALAGRILDCDSRVVITADGGMRGGKLVPLKDNVDAALVQCPGVSAVLTVQHAGNPVAMAEGRDRWWQELREAASPVCPPVEMGAEDPLFILYTSGSTGKPKGVLHTTGGYLTWAAMTHHYVFDYRPGQIYWCAADVGWVTGHSYVVYGPLANGATTVMFEGVPNWPTHSRFWEIVDRHQVEIFYGAPTALRALMREGDDWVTRTSRKSLRLLGSVGEPINPEAWEWYWRVVGEGRCPIVDTWWQTETGAAMITPLPGATDLKPGSASFPMFGIVPEIVDAEGATLEGAAEGNLCITRSWPGQMRTVWGDRERFFATYFTTYPGMYFTGDGCRRDEDGYYWITGRVDDVINVS